MQAKTPTRLTAITRCHWLGVGLGEEAELVRAGVVDQDLERARCSTTAAAEAGSVTSRADGLAADLAGDLAGPSVFRSPITTLGALGGEPARDRRADPARAAGDQRLATLEPHPRGSICARGPWQAHGAKYTPPPCRSPSRSSAAPGRWAGGWRCAGPRRPAGGDRLAQRGARRRGGRPPARGRARRRGRGTGERPTRRGAGRSSSSRSPFAPSRRTSTTCARRSSRGRSWSTAPCPTAAAVGGKATRSLGVWQGSAAQQAQEMVPDGVTVVAALHTVSAPVLGDPEAELDEDVLICGDRKADKARVARLVELIPGLRAVNAGRARDGADRRAADPAADLDQRPLQDARRNPDHGAWRGRPLGVGG